MQALSAYLSPLVKLTAAIEKLAAACNCDCDNMVD